MGLGTQYLLLPLHVLRATRHFGAEAVFAFGVDEQDHDHLGKSSPWHTNTCRELKSIPGYHLNVSRRYPKLCWYSGLPILLGRGGSGILSWSTVSPRCVTKFIVLA